MASLGQHRYFHGILLTEFLRFLDIPVTSDHIFVVKQMLKRHHSIAHVSDLTDGDYAEFITAVTSTLASEWGFEMPSESRKEMKELLDETNHKYNEE